MNPHDPAFSQFEGRAIEQCARHAEQLERLLEENAGAQRMPMEATRGVEPANPIWPRAATEDEVRAFDAKSLDLFGTVLGD